MAAEAAGDRDTLATLQRAVALDLEARWHEAHDLVAGLEGPRAAWMHAYLHRKEGDIGNARYWYARAGETPRLGSLVAERDELAAVIAAGLAAAR